MTSGWPFKLVAALFIAGTVSGVGQLPIRAQSARVASVARTAEEILSDGLAVQIPAGKTVTSRAIQESDKSYDLPKGPSRAVLFNLSSLPDGSSVQIISRTANPTKTARKVFSLTVDVLDGAFNIWQRITENSEGVALDLDGQITTVAVPTEPTKPKYLLIYTSARDVGKLAGTVSSQNGSIPILRSATGQLEFKIAKKTK